MEIILIRDRLRISLKGMDKWVSRPMSVFPPGIMMIVEKENERKNKRRRKKMEMTLAIFMGLGIFLGIPVVIGLAVTGGYLAATHKKYQAKVKVEKAVGKEKVTV